MMLLAKRFLVGAGIFLAGCSMPSLSKQGAAPPVISPCVVADQNLSPKEKEAIAELRRNVESGPLYTTPASAAGVAKCSAGYEAGVIALEYTFRDGGWLRAKRDSRIEYNDQEARFELPPGQDPTAVLKRAELAAFGASGCGIDWGESEKQPAEDDPQAVETIFRGDTCNCQARIRTKAAGRAVGFRFRSTC